VAGCPWLRPYVRQKLQRSLRCAAAWQVIAHVVLVLFVKRIEHVQTHVIRAFVPHIHISGSKQPYSWCTPATSRHARQEALQVGV